MADWKKQAGERVKSLSEGARQQLSVGDNCLRVCPDKKDITKEGKLGPGGVAHPPYRECRIHYGVGPDKKTLMCGYDIDGNGNCWLCDIKLPDLAKKGDKKKYADDISPRDCIVFNTSKFDPNTQKFSPAKPWWPSVGGGNSLGVRIFSRISTSKKDYVHPDKGHNINIKKTGEGMNTRYPEIEGDDSPTKLPASILAQMKDLDTFLPDPYDEETMKDAYFGRAPKDEVDDEDTDTDASEEGTEETAPEETPEGEEASEEYAEADPDAEDEPEEYEAEPDPDAPEEAPEEYEAEPEPEPKPTPKPKAGPRPVPPARPPQRPQGKPPARSAPKGKH